MGKGVRTVQRWEATLNLPVIRAGNGRSGIVMARTSELEAWVRKGQQRSHGNTDGWAQTHNAARATFAESVRELRDYQSEVKVLCDQVNATRVTLLHEIERLRSLCQAWDTVRGQTLATKNRELSKIN
jgi:hypothetical protein